jgi:hypothetical protein
MDCRSTSAAERARECAELAQWPKERKPIFFMETSTEVERVQDRKLCDDLTGTT